MKNAENVSVADNGKHDGDEKKALHIGCRTHKMPGAIGLGITPLPGVDVGA